MTRICNFPISTARHCKQPMADNKPNCGRHKTGLSAEQLGQNPTVYRKNGALHVWSGEPNDLYCLIHGDPAYQVLCQLAGETPPCCLLKDATWRDEQGQPHRDDGPASIWPDGEQQWHQHGLLHRDGGPARTWPDGTQYWYQHGKLHRDDGPAVIGAEGTQEWWQHGEQHRDDGPALIWPDGTQIWYQHGVFHRDDGPATIGRNGTQAWYQHGKLHREDGPAVIEADGTQYWYWYNKEVTEQKHAKLREQSKGV